MFACSPIASFGIGNEIALAGATLNAFIILDKLMSLVWWRLNANGHSVSTPDAPADACPKGSIFLSISIG